MVVVTKGSINHDGQIFRKGEVISDISKKEEERLIELGVCSGGVEIKPSSASDSNSEKAPNALGIEFNPDDAIKGKV